MTVRTDLDDVDVSIIDAAADAGLIAALRETGLQVQLARPSGRSSH